MIFIAINAAIALLSIGYSAYASHQEMKKAERQKRETVFEQSPYPIVDASSPIPLLYGTVQITGSNVVWRDLKMAKRTSFKSGDNTAWADGKVHDVVAHLVLCQKADHFFTLQMNGVPVFRDNSRADLLIGPVWQPLPTDKPRGGLSSFPSTGREQQIVAFEVLGGLPNQDTPRLFKDGAGTGFTGFVRKGETGEAYKGVVSLVIGMPATVENKDWYGIKSERKIEIPDVFVTLSNTSGESAIGVFRAANPSWILEDFLTNQDHDVRIDPAKIDRQSFDGAWAQLLDEEFGLNFLITDQAQASEFIAEVLRHIDAVLYQNRSTGKICLKLIREEDASIAPLLNENSIRLVNTYQKPDSSSLPTQQTIFYNRLTYQGQTTDNFDQMKQPDAGDLGWKTMRTAVEAHDTAGTYARGVVAAQSQDFPGIISPSLAARVAQRELRTACTPRASIEFEVNAGAISDVYPGDLIRISWNELGLEEAVFRVLTVDMGTLTNGTVSVTAIEDIFSFDENVIVDEPEVPPSDLAIPVVDQVAFELPLWMRRKTFGDYSEVPFELSACIAIAAANPEGTMTKFELAWEDEDLLTTDFVDSRRITNNGGSVPDSKWDYTSWIEWDGDFIPEFMGSYWIVRSHSSSNPDREIVKIIDYRPSSGEVRIARGMLDTPANHIGINYRMWRIAVPDGKALTGAATGIGIWFIGEDLRALTYSLRGNRLAWADALPEILTPFNPAQPTRFRHQAEYPVKNLYFQDGALATSNTEILWRYHSYLTDPRDQESEISDAVLGKTFNLVITGEAAGGGIFTRTVNVSSAELYVLTHANELSWNGLGRKSNWLAVTIITRGSSPSRDSLPQSRMYVRS